MRCPPSLPLASAVAALALLAGGGTSATHGPAVTPLNDLGSGTYLGFQGGLYEAGSNGIPTDHAAAGSTRAAAVRPLDTSGNPSATGKMVLVSIGMSNTTQEFCSASSAPPCDSWTFMGQAAADAGVNHTSLAIVNGAAGGQSATTWDSSADANYDRVRDTRLIPAGLSEQQVQIVWLKVANPGPTASLPAANSDAYSLETSMGNILRALKTRYPNLQLVFASSRIYAGYATTTLNPEPYAYESGFSVKWLIQAQVDQMRNGGTIVDARAGDLNYSTVAPWVGWGPYPWTDGLNPRSDGLTWVAADFVSDGTHPAQSGREKVGTMLLDFFKASPLTVCWFLVDTDGDGISDVCENADGDNDGFSDALEQHIGTDPLDNCANSAIPNNEADDRWGADFYDDQNLNIQDFGSFLFPLRPDGSFSRFFHPVPDPEDSNIVRWDLSPSTSINIADLNAINPAVLATTARPPMFNGEPAFARNCTQLPP